MTRPLSTFIMQAMRVGVIVIALVVSACARETRQESKDPEPSPPQARPESRHLTLDLGKGDSIWLAGHGDNFECDDPAHAAIDKVETLTLLFADGTSKRLCTRKHPSASKELAQQYVTARAGVLTFAEMRQASLGAVERRAFGMIATEFLRRHCSGANCSPDHPAWKRAAAVIEQDLHNMAAEIAADPQVRALPKQVHDAFVTGVSARLTSDELGELGAYYSRSPGREFLGIQERLVNAFTIGLVDIHERLAQGQRRAPQQRADPAELKELLSLLDETLKIQLAILDPGPGKDRSGLQAIPMMFMVVAQERFADLGTIWKQLPASERSAILAWRDSPLARKERSAIYESAKNIRTFFDPNSQGKRLAGAAAKYENKWRALIQAPPQ